MRNVKHFINLFYLTSIGSTFLLLSTTGMSTELLYMEAYQRCLLDEDADLPVWEEGNFWEYDIDILYDAETVVIDISIEELMFEVKNVNGESYNLAFHGIISGSIDLANIVGGNLINTGIDGNIKIRKSNLAVDKLYDVVVEGEIQRQFVTNSFHANIEMHQNVTPALSPYNFPISLNEMWRVPDMTFWVYLYANLNLAVPVEKVFSFPLVIKEHVLSCVQKETIIGSYGSFNDSFYVSGGDSQYNFWYSPTAHNVIRANQKNIIIWHNETPFILIDKVDIELVDTNFQPTNVPPDIPQKPSGPISGESGTLYPYTSKTMDSDGDQVYYNFDWGDGTDSGWLGPYNPGELATAEKEWRSQGTYNIRVKAKDVMGLESDYSEPLTVAMPKNKAINMNTLCHRFLEFLKERFPTIQLFHA